VWQGLCSCFDNEPAEGAERAESCRRAVRHDKRGSWTVGKCLRVSQTSLSCSSKMESWVWEGEGEMLVWKIGYGAERGSW
jgi:hypothetical protein